MITIYASQPLLFKIKNQLLIISFIKIIQNEIVDIIRVPIRNAVIEISRYEYLSSVLKYEQEKYQKYENGITFFKFKRIENIFFCFERDFVSFIQEFPSSCINFIQIAFLYWKLPIIYFFLMINILIAMVAILYWPPIREKAFKMEEKLGSKLAISLNNYKMNSRSLENLFEFRSVNQTDINAYRIAIISKHLYKIALCIPPVLLLGFKYSSNIFNFKREYFEDQFINEFLIFSLNFSKAVMSLVSFIGMSRGLDMLMGQNRIQDKKDNKSILAIDAIFCGLSKPISLEIKPAEKLIIIGPNGSGKTMFCRTITGNQNIISGKLEIPDNSILINSENYLFEVDFKRLKNLKLINERYEYLLEKKNLSKGQRNFLVTILALETNAELIAFDETLDSITGKMLEDAKKIIKSSEKIIVITSHREDIINWLSRKIYINAFT